MIRSILLFSVLFFACGTNKNVIEASELTTKEITQQIEAPRLLKSVDSLTIVQKGDFLFVKKPNDSTILAGELTVKSDSVTFIKNAKFTSSKPFVASNHNSWNTLLQKHVTKDGVVNYKGFKKDHAQLQSYISSLSDDSDSHKTWSKEDKLAYWINVYNALTVDLILRNYPIKSIKDIKKPWDQRLWMIGYLRQNLNDIEHKILRKMGEPRIHFAINCASFSCPPLLNEAFTAEKLESQLTQVTKAFLADSKRNTITPNKLELSKIFKWFSKDFKQNGSLIDFLNRYSDIKINENAKKSYKEYDWNLNE